MEEKVISADQKLAFIIRHAAIGVIEIRESGEIVDLNFVASRLLEMVSGRNVEVGDGGFDVLSLINPGIVQYIKSFEGTSGLIIDSHLYSVTTSEGEKHFLITANKMFADCLIVGIDDITVRRNEEKALQLAEQEKAVAQGRYEIASEVLHDIGNALVGFSSHLSRINRILQGSGIENLEKLYIFLQQNEKALVSSLGEQKTSALLTMTGALNKTVMNGVGLVKSSANEQLRVVSHIQDILNIQRQYVLGHQSQERKPVNLKEVIGDCRSMLSGSLEKRGIRFILSVPSTPVLISGDRTKLMQMVLNLLKNSIEAIEPTASHKEIRVSLSVTPDKVHLTILDSGKGFDEDTATQLFRRGYTSKSQGTGLGLYTSKSIIESHDGKITMESKGLEQGCRTTIEFNR